MKEGGWVPLWLTGKKCAATESRLTALSQWTARYKSVISPKSLFFWLTDKFTKVTVFTVQGGSSSVQNLDPLREMGRDVAVKLLVEKWTHKHEKWDWAWCHTQTQWLTIPFKWVFNKIIALQAVFSLVNSVILFTGSINFVSNDIHVCWILKKMVNCVAFPVDKL